jgi:hypothetical protein
VPLIQQLRNILGCYELLFDNQLHSGVYGAQARSDNIAFRLPHGRCKRRHLTVDVGDIDHIGINKSESAHSGTAQHLGSPRAYTTKPNDKHTGIAKPHLPLLTQQQLAALQPIFSHKTALFYISCSESTKK